MRASARVITACPVSTLSGSPTSACRSRPSTGAHAPGGPRPSGKPQLRRTSTPRSAPRARRTGRPSICSRTSRATPHGRSRTSSTRSSRCSPAAARPRRLVPVPCLPEGTRQADPQADRDARDLWAHLQIPAGMTAGQARAWLQASEQEATPESVQEIVELSASMEDFEFVPDPNAHLSVMGGVALRISELLLPRPWWIAEYDSPALLTSDKPVALHFRDRSRRPGYDRGIAHADEIWFPLDRAAAAHPGQPRRPAARATPAPGCPHRCHSEPHHRGRCLRAHLHASRAGPPEGATATQTRPRSPGQRDLPVDLGRYNQPVANTRTPAPQDRTIHSFAPCMVPDEPDVSHGRLCHVTLGI